MTRLLLAASVILLAVALARHLGKFTDPFLIAAVVVAAVAAFLDLR